MISLVFRGKMSRRMGKVLSYKTDYQMRSAGFFLPSEMGVVDLARRVHLYALRACFTSEAVTA